MIDAREWISCSRAFRRATSYLSDEEAKNRLLEALSGGMLSAKADVVTQVGRSRPDETRNDVILDADFWFFLLGVDFSTGVAFASASPSEGPDAKTSASGLAFAQASFENLLADEPAPKTSGPKGLGGRQSQLRSAEVVAKVTLELVRGREGKFMMPTLGDTTALVEAEYRAILGGQGHALKEFEPQKGLPPEATLETLAQGVRRALKNFER